MKFCKHYYRIIRRERDGSWYYAEVRPWWRPWYSIIDYWRDVDSCKRDINEYKKKIAQPPIVYRECV